MRDALRAAVLSIASVREGRYFRAAVVAIIATACSSQQFPTNAANRPSPRRTTVSSYEVRGDGYVITMSQQPKKQSYDLLIDGASATAFTVKRGQITEQVRVEHYPDSYGVLDAARVQNLFGIFVMTAQWRGATSDGIEPIPHHAGAAFQAELSTPDHSTMYAAEIGHKNIAVFVAAAGPGTSEHAAFVAMLDSLQLS